MLRTLVILIIFLFANSVEARFPHGMDEVAVTTCDINTGIATGLDAGTCASPAAACDGVTNVSAAFVAFNTWAKATTTNANGQLIELRVTGNCVFATGNAATFTGLKKARLWGYGATFTSDNNQPALGAAGGTGFAGICHKSLADANGCSARVASVLIGASAVTLLNTALCPRFTVGLWAVVTGFDLQGSFTSFGYPPNPQFFDYVQILSTSNCVSTGQITLNRALTNSYLSTWPNFGSGTSGEADQGGPATIYALDANWGGGVDIRGVTIDSSNQSIYQGRSTRLQDVTMTGSNCIIPSQNETFTMINSTGINCAIEVDKIINNLTYNNTNLRRLAFQSASTNTLTWTGGSLSLDMNGTAKVANITNLTTPTFRIGPYAYGTATSASCASCAITNPITNAGVSEDGFTGGANIFYAVSGGVFSYPISQNVTNAVDNGSGKTRLSVVNATGWAVGAGIGLSNLGTCVPACTGGSTILAVDTVGNTIDINITFSTLTWSGAGTVYNDALQERWAIPGTNVTASGTSQIAAGVPFFQVTSVTQSGGLVNIATTLSGGYPNVPLPGSGKSNLTVQTPKWTCMSCVGNVQMTQDFASQPANTPAFSYSNRSYTNSTSLLSTNLWGKVTSIKINVTQAYTGATSPMTFGFNDQAVTSAGAFTSWNGPINLRQAGLRTITPAGVTCDTGGGPVAGSCSGDGALTLTDPAMMFAGSLNLSKPNGSPTDQPWAMDYEFIMDQGVVP